MFLNCGGNNYGDYDSNYLAGTGGSCSQPSQVPSTEWRANAFVGLSWSIGQEGMGPHLSAGVRGVNVGSNGFVYGAEANFSLSLSEGFNDAQIRLVGLAGNTSALGNGGVGWDITKQSFILNAGIQIPYLRAFLDYTIDDATLRAFLETNSYGKLDATPLAAACGPGTQLDTPAKALADVASLFPGFYAVGALYSGGYVTNGIGVNILPPIGGVRNEAVYLNGETCFETPDVQPTP